MEPRYRRLSWITTIAVVSASGCSVLLDLEEPVQCRSNEDCWERRGLTETVCDEDTHLCKPVTVADDSSTSTDVGTESSASESGSVDESSSGPGPDLPEEPDDPVWGCVGHLPLPMATPGARHLYRTQIVNTTTGRPPLNPQVRLCSILDLLCANPVLSDIPVDDDGYIEVEVNSGFEGYFEFTGDDIGPHLNPLGGPVVKDKLEVVRPLDLVDTAVRTGLLANIGIESDPERGFLLLGSRNCLDERVAGVRVSVVPADEETIVFYFNGVVPSLPLTETDASGGAGIANVLPGIANVTASRVDPETKEEIEVVARHALPVRANWTTITFLPPTP